MDSMRFDVDFRGIRTRLIVGLVVEGIAIGLLLGGFIELFIRGLIPEGTTLDLVEVILGVLLAHFDLSLI